MGIALQAGLVAGAIAVAIGAAPARAEPVAAVAPRQLVVVTAADWRATTGELRRFERDARSGWRPVGAPVRVSLGKSGLGWSAADRARASGPARDGASAGDGAVAGNGAVAAGSAPDKREGDGRSPAGRFALGLVTGYDAAPPTGTRLPYRMATAALRCVDDARAPQYNLQVDAPDGGAPWSSDEPMRRADELYRLTLFVAYNPARLAGAGSCIFLHVWRAPDSPTVGCTAMALDRLRELVAWLDPAAHPELVQLPRAEYARLQRAWGLPPLVAAAGGDGKRK